ncbi:MAG TPA: DUF58 domain-containing protein [Acidimicrobiia bacterium]|nr:DUF58 domain-containing protein [Acidimicrobiia bacterium]
MTDQDGAGRRWRLGNTALSWTAMGYALVLLGLVVGRPEVIGIGMPLVIGMLWSWSHRPTDTPDVTLRDCRYRTESGRVEGSLVVTTVPGVATISVRVGSEGHRPADALLSASSSRPVTLAVSGTRTGRRSVFDVAHILSADDHVAQSVPAAVGPVDVKVLPRTRPSGRLPLPFRLQGLTGAHDSRRIGDGGDFHDISEFVAGDRLRRIDWRVTARRIGQGGAASQMLDRLYVRRSHATADAVVMLVLDSRDDIGPDVSTWASSRPVHPDDQTSLDIAREAAGTLARGYLEAGDRVGVVDLGRTSRALRPAGGRRHLSRVLHQLADARPEGEVQVRIRPPQLPSGAMAVVFSTFLDDETVGLAELWRAAGHRVLAVDVIPPIDTERITRQESLAHRIVELERGDRMFRLRAGGVDVVPWSDDRSLDAGLQASTRRRPRERR